MFLLYYWRRKIFCSNSDEEYYDEECINLFSKNSKKYYIRILFKACDFKDPSWNIKSFLSLAIESSTSRNIRKFLKVGIFIFEAQKVSSWNIRKIWRNMRQFLILESSKKYEGIETFSSWVIFWSGSTETFWDKKLCMNFLVWFFLWKCFKMFKST